jgi:hypothetical protein
VPAEAAAARYGSGLRRRPDGKRAQAGEDLAVDPRGLSIHSGRKEADMATAIPEPEVRRVTRVPQWLRGETLAPLTGIASALFGAAGVIVLEGFADRPDADSDPGAFLAYFQDRNTVILGSFLLMLSVVCFLWYLGSLQAVLRRAEGDAGRLSAIAHGGGLITAALMLAMPGVAVLGAMYADHLTAAEAKTLFAAGEAFLYPAAIAAAVLVAATALVALRTAALARWLAWLSLALAVWLLIPPFGSAGGTPGEPTAWTGLFALIAVPLWIAVTAVMLLLGSRDR